jgi:hypothetical protein
MGKYTLSPEVSNDLHFCLQSFKYDTLPPQLSNYSNLTTDIFFPNASITFFFSFFFFGFFDFFLK